MDRVLLEGLFLLGSAMVGGGLALAGSWSGAELRKIKERNRRLESMLTKLLKQIEAYHLLEDLYAETLAENGGLKSVKTYKTDFRDRVVQLHQCARPEMTANEANKRLREYE